MKANNAKTAFQEHCGNREIKKVRILLNINASFHVECDVNFTSILCLTVELNLTNLSFPLIREI